MSTIIQGVASQVSTPLGPVAIASYTSSGGTTTVSTAPTAHLFGNGDLNVVISGATGATSLNGTWGPITVISSTSFSFAGTVTGTLGGSPVAYDYSLTPPFQAPTGGDAFIANSILPGLQQLASRDAFLRQRQLLVSGYTYLVATSIMQVSAGNWQAGVGGQITTGYTRTLSSGVPVLQGTIGNVLPTDTIEVSAAVYTTIGALVPTYMDVEYQYNYNVSSPSGSTSPLAYSQAEITVSGLVVPMLGQTEGIVSETTGVMAIFLNGYTTNDDCELSAVSGGLIWKQYRTVTL
jgi:hypothetical protein